MATLNYDQLKALWISNGGNPDYAGYAAAIALAESGGRTDATNRNVSKTGKVSYDTGLWQINGAAVDQALFDPNANAKVAVSMSNKGNNWRPWCTAYSDGACGYKGGTYFAAGSPFFHFLKGSDGAKVPGAGGATFGVDKGNPNQILADPGQANPDKSQAGDPGYNPCLLSLPSIAGQGGGCLLKLSQAKAIGGVALMVAGGLVMLVGVALLTNQTAGLIPSPLSPRTVTKNSGGLTSTPKPDDDDDLAVRAEDREPLNPPMATGGGRRVVGRSVAIDEL